MTITWRTMLETGARIGAVGFGTFLILQGIATAAFLAIVGLFAETVAHIAHTLGLLAFGIGMVGFGVYLVYGGVRNFPHVRANVSIFFPAYLG